MKKIGVLLVIVMLAMSAASAQAEVKAGSVSVTPFFGFYNFESRELDFDNSYTLGLRAGYNFTENVGVEGVFNYVKTDVNGLIPITRDDDVYMYGLGVEGLYHFFPDGKIVPFLAAGIGNLYYDSPNGHMDKLTFDYGAGLKIFLTEDVALRADIRHVIPMNETYNDLMGTIGISFAFGGKSKCVDTDGDGVCDDIDKCPRTPTGCKVDKEGCSSECLEKAGETEAVPSTGAEKAPVQEPSAATVTGVPAAPTAASPSAGVAAMRDKVIITLNVEFNTAKAIVNEKYYEDIKKVADFMKAHPETTAVIEGYTDNVGNAPYNKALSQKRAESVRQYLIDKFDIKGTRLKAMGYGEEKPVAGNDTPEGRQKNRRVEAVISVKK
jgi:OOP family OmpA-OmpF porin